MVQTNFTHNLFSWCNKIKCTLTTRCFTREKNNLLGTKYAKSTNWIVYFTSFGIMTFFTALYEILQHTDATFFFKNIFGNMILNYAYNVRASFNNHSSYLIKHGRKNMSKWKCIAIFLLFFVLYLLYCIFICIFNIFVKYYLFPHCR